MTSVSLDLNRLRRERSEEYHHERKERSEREDPELTSKRTEGALGVVAAILGDSVWVQRTAGSMRLLFQKEGQMKRPACSPSVAEGETTRVPANSTAAPT